LRGRGGAQVAEVAAVLVIVGSAGPALLAGGQGPVFAGAVGLFVLGLVCQALAKLRAARSGVVLAAAAVTTVGAAGLIACHAVAVGMVGLCLGLVKGAFRLPSRMGGVLLAVAVLSVSLAGWAEGRLTVSGILVNDLAVVGFFVTATLGRQLRESNERLQVVLAELVHSRAAQADAAVLAERQRLAREIHDVLAHSLSGLVLSLEGARLLAARGTADEQVTALLSRCHRLAGEGLQEVREAIGALRDDSLTGPERLPDLVDAFRADTAVPCVLTVTGSATAMPADRRLTLYRVAQEALSNVRKHARPDRVEVALSYDSDGVTLTVQDDAADTVRCPTTAPVSVPQVPGHGLAGMRERAELTGGTLSCGPTGCGYRVELWMPT